jgi:hypothetical protein
MYWIRAEINEYHDLTMLELGLTAHASTGYSNNQP